MYAVYEDTDHPHIHVVYKEHLRQWKKLTAANKDALGKYTEFLLSQQD